ncbi:PREDICTED: flocculation protein FLO11-like [Leptosomus discolor]|nr:PREDICTED: flocculation protein FLO11-like [Leptosomus discolor]
MKAVSLQVLFVLRVLCLVTLAGGQPKASLKCSRECGRFTSQIAVKWIRSYRRTERHCPKEAIIFITLKSMEICADPKAEWVKKIIQKLDKEKATASLLPPDADSAVAPEEPGVFQKHVGLTVTAPSQATAPTSFFQGTGTTLLERIHVPAAQTEASNKSPPATQDTTQLPAGSSPMIREVAAHSEVTSQPNRDSLISPAPSTTFAAGMVSSQPTPYPMSLVHGFDNAVGFAEELVGHTANIMAAVQDTSSPSSNSDLVAITKGSDHPLLSTNKSREPTSARANAPDTASSSLSSDLPSILDSMEITTVPATPVPPETTSVSTLNSTAIDKGPSVATNKVVSSSAEAFGTRTFDYSSPVGKQEPSDTLVLTSQAFSDQARVQMPTERPSDLPLPSFLSRSQMHFVIPVAVVGGLMVLSVAVVWLYLKFGVKTEEMSREIVQGLLYRKQGHQNNVCLMEVI